MIRRSIVLLSVWAALVGMASADQIREVTVFLDGALVTRAKTAEVGAGSHTVVFDKLPDDLDPETIRAGFDAGVHAQVAWVDIEEVSNAELFREDERRLNTEVERIGDQIRTLDDKIKVKKLKMDVITSMANHSAEAVRSELERSDMQPAAWPGAWLTLEEGASEALATIHQIEIKKRSLDAELSMVIRELSKVRSGSREHYRATVLFDAAVAGRFEVLLTYAVEDAEWEPVYDAHLDTGNESLKIAVGAQINQNTGENWNDVLVSLSTANTLEDAEFPYLDTWMVNFVAARKSSRDDNMERAIEMAIEQSFAEEIRVVGTTFELDGSEYASTYRIKSRASVPSDGEDHRLNLDEFELPAAVGVMVVPREEQSAFIIADATYDGHVPLMSGPMMRFVDGTYRGSGYFPRLRPGTDLELVFGIDHRILVAFAEDIDQKRTSGIVNRKHRIESWSEARIKNSHSKPVEITIIDHMPVAEDESIKIEMLEGTTPPTGTDIDDQPGTLEWKKSVAPGQEFKVDLGYSVSYPKDREIWGL